MLTRIIGAAGVEELLHMVFRVPDGPPVEALRRDLVELANCDTDDGLFRIAVAALYNGKSDWLAAKIEEDLKSDTVWKRKREQRSLAGFTVGESLPVADAWPAGIRHTDNADLRYKSARLRSTDACARHWWRVYLSSKAPIRRLHAAGLFSYGQRTSAR